MTQGWFERVGFYFAKEVIPSRTKIPRGENSARRDFPFEVEIMLQRIWEFWMVSGLKNVNRLRQERILRIEKDGKHIGIYAFKRRQKPIDTKQQYGELIAKDPGCAPQHSLTITEDVPCKAG